MAVFTKIAAKILQFLQKSSIIGAFFVEVAGVEPASKQGTRRFSTRLADVYSSSCRQGIGSQPAGTVPYFKTAHGTLRRPVPKKFDTPYDLRPWSTAVCRDTRRRRSLVAGN